MHRSLYIKFKPSSPKFNISSMFCRPLSNNLLRLRTRRSSLTPSKLHPCFENRKMFSHNSNIKSWGSEYGCSLEPNVFSLCHRLSFSHKLQCRCASSSAAKAQSIFSNEVWLYFLHFIQEYFIQVNYHMEKCPFSHKRFKHKHFTLGSNITVILIFVTAALPRRKLPGFVLSKTGDLELDLELDFGFLQERVLPNTKEKSLTFWPKEPLFTAPPCPLHPWTSCHVSKRCLCQVGDLIILFTFRLHLQLGNKERSYV